MDVKNSYNNYKKYLPDYEPWRDKQDLASQRRLEYLKRHPEKMNEDDIERGKSLLHAIDVMDEFSQNNAEDMEVATDFATSQVVSIATTLGILIGLPFSRTKWIRSLVGKLAQNNLHGMDAIISMVPSAIGMVVGMAASFPAIVWATKAQVSASRKGRFEAMRTDLSDPVNFAVLTPEQRNEVEKIAKNIKIDEKDKKKAMQVKGLGGNPLTVLKTLKKYFSKNGEYVQQKKDFDNKLKERKAQFDKPLTPEQIRNAKKDQQILFEMVRKMDVASQDYAENVELATNTLTVLSLGTGGLVGWVSNKLLKLMKVNSGSGFAKFIPWIVGASIPVIMGIYAAKVQKHASRVGRFKVKQEMLNNPASLVYVDDAETSKMTDVKLAPRPKKPNIFKFFIQFVKDNKEYQKYRKAKGLEDLKFYKALGQIKLSPEQLKEAKALQMNVFNTFNTVDEKSQDYSESVEAMGEISKQGVATFGSLASMGISIAMLLKMLKNPDNIKKLGPMGVAARSLLPFAFMLLPVIAIDAYTTKAQKKASRVADMLALKDLEDYRNYADYSK